MSAFDAEISVLSATLGTPSEEALEAGAPPHVELGIVAGLALPMANPQTNQPLIIPIGKLRFTFTREQAIEIFQAAVEAAQSLPEVFTPSGKVFVANNMNDVAAAAESIKQFT